MSLSFDCPRCGAAVADERYYGPCSSCRTELRRVGGEAREVEVEAYEPKMNVVPNQIATKD